MKLEICCVRCGTTNSDRAAVEEAIQYQRDLAFDPGVPDLINEGGVFQVWDVCPDWCDELEHHGPRPELE
jgi:hypothetical protein